MSKLQVENSTTSRRAVLYQKIATVIDQMPDRFQATELYERAGIKRHNHPGHRMMIASILQQDFKLLQITQPGGKRHWKKP